MGMRKIEVALLCVVSLAMMDVTIAQSNPTDYVNAHNTTRSQVSVGGIVWDNTLATVAQNYANSLAISCSLVNSNGPYGENLAWGAGTAFKGTDAVNLWVFEKQFYTYSTNTCASGKVCTHYTQVVWQNSVRLGCSRKVCNNNAATIVVCNYDPPGNVLGKQPY